MSAEYQEAMGEQRGATVAGVTTITTSLVIFFASFALWLVMVILVLFTACVTGGLGLMAWPFAVLITAVLHGVLSLTGAVCAVGGMVIASRTPHRGRMTAKAIVVLGLHLTVLGALVALIIAIEAGLPGVFTSLL